MTLQTYSPEQLDELALRMLDLAALLRQVAQSARQHEIPSLPIHDKKALDWFAKLESWGRRCQSDMELTLHSAKAARRAQLFLR